MQVQGSMCRCIIDPFFSLNSNKKNQYYFLIKGGY